MMPGNRTVLFLCTGNYYRSRFAEHLFNHLVAASRLDWRAESRGLRLHAGNVGPISEHAIAGLERLGVPLAGEQRLPLQCQEEDLEKSHRIVAVKHAEHRPLVEQRFPAWLERIEFWHIHDIDYAHPDQALPELQQQVVALLEDLRCPAVPRTE